MAIDKHIRRGHPVLFGLLMLFAIIEGSIAAYLVARFNQRHNFTSLGVRNRVRFLLFTSWWTVIGSFLLMLLVFAGGASLLTSVASHAIFLGLTWIFWFAAAIAITVALDGGTHCSSVTRAVVYCNQLNALIAFAWVCWALTTILLIAVLVRGASSLRQGEGGRGQVVDNNRTTNNA